jgi:hypothetical protein
MDWVGEFAEGVGFPSRRDDKETWLERIRRRPDEKVVSAERRFV